MSGASASTDPDPRRTPSRWLRVSRAVAVPVLLGLVVSAGASSTIRVERGDTLWSIAQRHGTTVDALRELNGIPGNSSLILAGQSLKVPGSAKTSTPSRRRVATRYHTVVEGDSLIRIARRYGKSADWVAWKNKLPRSRVVVLGDRLIVGTRAVSAPRTTPAPRPAPQPRQQVSRERVRQLIRAESRRAGVDPELVLALSYLESGFQQDVTSSVGAVGVMQVMPETGRWVGSYLVGRPLDLHDVEDNVVAGVRFFAFLLRITDGREPSALAGYYQGLASVRRNGMYTDTKQYVANILAIRRRFERG